MWVFKSNLKGVYYSDIPSSQFTHDTKRFPSTHSCLRQLISVFTFISSQESELKKKPFTSYNTQRQMLKILGSTQIWPLDYVFVHLKKPIYWLLACKKAMWGCAVVFMFTELCVISHQSLSLYFYEVVLKPRDTHIYIIILLKHLLEHFQLSQLHLCLCAFRLFCLCEHNFRGAFREFFVNFSENQVSHFNTEIR